LIRFVFGPGFDVYQYLFKQNRPEIPFAHDYDPVGEAAIDQRRQFLEAKRNELYQVATFYCIVLEGSPMTRFRSSFAYGEAPRPSFPREHPVCT
jgi:hypothetical protein